MYFTLKRWGDVVLAILLFLPSSIITAIILAILRLEVDGSPIFVQRRIGYKGKIFKIYKIRTMSNKKSDEKNTPESDDRRLGRLGKVIRKSGLDELPEIINIILGDMSFVGPRPLLTRYRKKYSEFQWRRHSVLPGITGLAQINGKEELAFDRRFEYDVHYVDNISFALDIWIMIMTTKTIFFGISTGYTKHVNLPQFK